MKRDMDYVRTLLLRIEELKLPDSSQLIESDDADDFAKMVDHLKMLIEEAGYVSGCEDHVMGPKGEYWGDLRLTWTGHEYLDTIRDDEVWRNTKKGISAVGSVGVEMLMALAKGFARKKIEDHTGITLQF